MHGWESIYGLLPDARYRGGVYALYRSGALIYVGRTGNLRTRIMAHRRRFEFDCVKVASIDSARARKVLERKLLFRLRPIMNIVLPARLHATSYMF